ncbi:MAG TPA: N-6 DNA methylase [Candidatus Syntrophosphaera sp.]|nr:N-6 DNA methylase [Candidatus Syntrophosphaera sp.]
MLPLDKTLRNKLEKTIKEARETAEAGAKAALVQLGVADANAPGFLSDEDKALRRKLRVHGRQLGDARYQDSRQAIDILTEEIAYEHWHRMLFARFLAENDLLMDDDPANPVSLSLEDCEALAPEQNATSAWELAARYASRMLPQIFRTDSPVFQLSLPPEHQHSLEKLLTELPPETFTASDSLGWVYQFWQAKKKDDVNKSEVKIGAKELPAVTQLFTEPYMVQFLLDNSLGAWWGGKRLSVDDLKNAKSEDELREKAAIPGVPLSYLRFVQEDGTWRPAAGTFANWPQDVKDLKILDPCCGSGHFLVSTFRMLIPIYTHLTHFEVSSACVQVLRDCLYGLELDKRCVEISVFALALAAWTYPGSTGYRPLPQMNIACCGLSVGSAKEEWAALANGNAALRQALTWLHDFYQDAPLLGSLLDPKADQFGEFIRTHYPEYAFDKLLAKLRPEEELEAGLAAKGLLDATLILMNEYDLVITNVPYLARGKQSPELQKHCEKHFPTAKNDLATVFLDRCLQLCHAGGTASIVLPQNWLFLTSYKKFREKLLNSDTWHLIARLGPQAFQTPMWDFNVQLLLISRGQVNENEDIYADDSFANQLCGLDVSEFRSAQEKGEKLIEAELKVVSQARQLKNPDARIMIIERESSTLLAEYSASLVGIQTGDYPRFVIYHWETDEFKGLWDLYERPGTYFVDRTEIILWQNGNGSFLEFVKSKLGENGTGAWLRGSQVWGKRGVSIQLTNYLTPSLFYGAKYDQTLAVIKPNNECVLSALWCFCSSPEFSSLVREIDQKLNVTNATLVKVPFDLEHWQKVAEEKYPNGLPEPYSDDPTQWIFHGHPCGSVVWSEECKKLEQGPLRKDSTVLQVALARLLGYQWPAENDANIELSEESRFWVKRCKELYPFADEDGIVCISPVRGEESAMDRIIKLLAAAYGDEWSPAILNELLAACDHAGKSLESWLRDKFFAQHCKLFMHRPFIWQIWDGLRDGFSALVNYHKLDNRKLQSLIYSYLGDWITRQKHDLDSGIDGASEKLAAAETLQKKLILILEGEAPCDIFVRWKPIEKQAIGWNPDLNDGVRMNIRPFVIAEVLRHYKKPILNINWDKDRGKDVPSAPWYHIDKGDRINDRHISLKEKKGVIHDK